MALFNPTLSRRNLIEAAATLGAVSMMGSMDAVLRQQALAAGVGDRKFLFFFASGGWDATPLDPKFGDDGVSPVGGTDMDPNTFLGQAGNLTYTSGDDRLNMDRFFKRWGHRSAIVRGVNVHTAGHDSGTQWMMTGSSASSLSDWPTILASKGTLDYPMPHLVFSGPNFPGEFGAAVVRGGGGTLLDLIDGSFNGLVDAPQPAFPIPSDQMMDSVLYNRAGRVQASTEGRTHDRMDDLMGNLERSMELEGRRFEAGLDGDARSVLDQAMMALQVMRLGLTRCAMIRIPGGWDTHGGNQNVGPQLDNFYSGLDQLFEHMATTPGLATPWLQGEVVVVCTSELGRTPRFNGAQGRDHWPYTSMLVAGSGVNGNTVAGATDAGLISNPINFSTGREDSAGGSPLGCENVGVSLLQLGGVDSERHLPGVPGLDAILRRA